MQTSAISGFGECRSLNNPRDYCARNTLWAWGNNANGELGIASPAAVVGTPTRIGSDMDWQQIGAGH